ncbi:MAG: hypothetical protein F4W95_06645 [Chloroflexi bacterium]|nr:hypothetical protein [Chloroflexota bacterium]MYD48148.1 hypothetical protein [Chloroflexota bacterium]
MSGHTWYFLGADDSYVQEPVETCTWATVRLMGGHTWRGIGVDLFYVQEPVETCTWATQRLLIVWGPGSPVPAPMQIAPEPPLWGLEDAFPSFWTQPTEPEDGATAWEC